MIVVKTETNQQTDKGTDQPNEVELEFQADLRLMNSCKSRKHHPDPLVGDGGLDNEDVVDQVKLLPQRDLQNVHLHNERGEEGAKTKTGRESKNWLDLKSKKHHENDLLSCFKEVSIEHRGARAVWSAEHKRVF